MSYWAGQIQAKAMELAKAYYGTWFKTYRITPMLQVHPQDLPVLGIYILRERRENSQANQAEPKFNTVLTLGFSGGVHVETSKQDQLSALEDAMSELDELLLREPSFVKMTEGIPSMDRTSQFAKVGETTLYEIRIEMMLQNSEYYPPRVDDTFETLHVTTQFPDQEHVDSGTPQIVREYELDQNS
jgi:hypothetical protein